MRVEGRAAYCRWFLARGLRERTPAVTLLESCARRERRRPRAGGAWCFLQARPAPGTLPFRLQHRRWAAMYGEGP